MKQLIDYLIIERLDKNKIHQYEGMKGIDDNIQKWYKKKFSSDEAGDDIRADYTFGDLLRDIFGEKNIYDALGEDSIVRERVFKELSLRVKCSYNDVYDAWANIYYK